MSASEPRKRLAVHQRFYLAGTLVLLLGLAGAAWAWLAATDSVEFAVDYGGDRRAALALERVGGKATVWAVELNQWLAGLWHGRQLAYTLAYLTIALALVCFLLGDRLSPGRHRPRPPQDAGSR